MINNQSIRESSIRQEPSFRYKNILQIKIIASGGGENDEFG